MFSPFKVSRYRDRTVVEVFYGVGAFAAGGATEREARVRLLESASEFSAELSAWVEREREELHGGA